MQRRLQQAIVLDQLLAVRRTVRISIPINILLGLASVLVAVHAGKGELGVIWFLNSLAVNVARFVLCRRPIEELPSGSSKMPAWSVERHLLVHCILACLSGFVWAAIPILCDWYTSGETLFYLVVVCGITAGAATYGFAYARIPISFICPPLLSVILCLIIFGAFERFILAATVALYLTALIRGALVGQELVVTASRLKNEAKALTQSLEKANEEKSAFALEMQRRAIRDELTTLLNRAGFTDAVQKLSTKVAEATLLLIDLDGFKSVNDIYGHKAGDRVLTELARRLIELFGDDAVIGRLGGDEFAIVIDCRLPDEEAELLATRLIATIAIPFSRLERGRVGASIGIFLGSLADLDEATICADTALYAAKRAGRNRFKIFDESLLAHSLVTRDIERDIGHALSNNMLEVWYQPILSGSGLVVESLEAILRWEHPHHGSIEASHVVNSAANSGCAEALFDFVLAEVISTARALDSLFTRPVSIAFNVSPRELAQLAVDELVIEKFTRNSVSPSLIQLEIREESALNTALVKEKLTKLSNFGVRFTVDEFGTGYSSIVSLREIYACRVKLDRSLVSGANPGSPNWSLIDAIVRISHAFQFDVVATGVDNEADFIAMQKLNCSLLQGDYFVHPMPQQAALQWVEKRISPNPL